jgi:hypothetical protein
MTEEEVKALIKELRDDIPSIIQQFNDDADEKTEKEYQKSLKDNK